MARQSIIEEGELYKLNWELLTNTISYMSIFLTLIWLISLKTGLDLSIEIVLFCISILLCLVLSLTKSTLIQFLGNVLPTIFLFAAVTYRILNNPVEGTQLKDLFQFFLLDITVFSFVNGALREIYDLNQALKRASAFIVLQFYKIAVIFASAYLLNTFVNFELSLNLPFITKTVQIQSDSFYIIINLSILIFQLLAVVIMLFIRASALEKISWRLKEISGWSFDDKLVEESFLESPETMKNTTRTVMFGDIRGFTAFTEWNNIHDTVNILSEFYRLTETIVAKYNGYKPEFIADEFITFFNDPHDAIKCALSISREINNYLSQFGLGLGIGVHHGQVMEGIIGGKNSKKYTVMGGVVNIASRLQSNAGKGQILLSAAVLNQINEVIPHVEQQFGIRLKGVDDSFQIFSYIGFVEKPKPELTWKQKLFNFFKEK